MTFSKLDASLLMKPTSPPASAHTHTHRKPRTKPENQAFMYKLLKPLSAPQRAQDSHPRDVPDKSMPRLSSTNRLALAAAPHAGGWVRQGTQEPEQQGFCFEEGVSKAFIQGLRFEGLLKGPAGQALSPRVQGCPGLLLPKFPASGVLAYGDLSLAPCWLQVFTRLSKPY